MVWGAAGFGHALLNTPPIPLSESAPTSLQPQLATDPLACPYRLVYPVYVTMHTARVRHAAG